MEIENSDRLDRHYRDFSRAIRDEDSFILLYELTHREQPVSVEFLAREFGAGASYILEVLGRLERLKVAGRLGRSWAASSWAALMLRDLEESLAAVQLETMEASTASSNISLIGEATVATYNGLWTAGVSSITTAVDQDSASGARTAAGAMDQATGFTSERPDLAHNETEVTIIGDDIRVEVDNKLTLVGVYDEAILFPELPARLLKLAFYQRWLEASTVDLKKMSVQLAGSAIGELVLRAEARPASRPEAGLQSIRVILTHGPLDFLREGEIEFVTYFNDEPEVQHRRKLTVGVDPNLRKTLH